MQNIKETANPDDERLIVLIPPDMKRDLRLITWERKESMGAFVRQAIQEKLEKSKE